MVAAKAMLAIVTAIVLVTAFSFVSPLVKSQAAATTGLTAIPAPSSCTYAGHPADPISQTTVSFPSTNFVPPLTKHAEKELYDCIISGSTKHYILDTTTYTTALTGEGMILSYNFVECAKDRATATVYSCQTEKVGSTLLPTNKCLQLGLGFPQAMDTVVIGGLIVTVESQKEIFKCNTSSGPVIQELIIWTATFDKTDTTALSFYEVQTCQKPFTISTGLPLLNCQIQGVAGLTG